MLGRPGGARPVEVVLEPSTNALDSLESLDAAGSQGPGVPTDGCGQMGQLRQGGAASSHQRAGGSQIT